MADTKQGQHTAGAFDIRNFIGALLGIFGIILLFMGLFGDTEEAKTGGINANLWGGIMLVIGAAIFLVWAWLRPTIVPAHVETPDDPAKPGPTAGGH